MCFFTSLAPFAPRRLSGSRVRSAKMRSVTSGEKLFTSGGLHFIMRLKIVELSSEIKFSSDLILS